MKDTVDASRSSAAPRTHDLSSWHAPSVGRGEAHSVASLDFGECIATRWRSRAKRVSDVRARVADPQFGPQYRCATERFQKRLCHAGLHTLPLAGGIGEDAAIVRWSIYDKLGFFGVELGMNRNMHNATLIFVDDIKVAVRVIQPDEELMIAWSIIAVFGTSIRQSVEGGQNLQ